MGKEQCTYILGEDCRVDAFGFLDVVGVFENVPELMLQREKVFVAKAGSLST